jgi:hypothetical protein
MDIQDEHRKQIEEIMSHMKCSHDFQCYKSGFTNLCRCRKLGNRFECLDERASDCGLSFPFGYSYFCQCRLRIYLAKDLELLTKISDTEKF